MFKKRAWVAAFALIAGAGAAQADTVEMLLDVTATGVQVSHLDQGGSLVTTNDSSFAPQQFQWLIRFDLDQPNLYPIQSSTGTNGLQLTTSTFFKGGDISMTPYSSMMMDAIPAGAQVLSPDTAQIYTELATTNMLGMPFVGAQPVSVHSGFTAGGTSQLVENGFAFTTAYGRGFSFEGAVAPVLNSQFHPMSGQEFVSYLQAFEGRTQVGAFNESFTQWVQKTNAPGDVILVSDAPDALVAQEGVRIIGNVAIRSVTVVPEPATYVLMGLGLPLLAAVRRRSKRA